MTIALMIGGNGLSGLSSSSSSSSSWIRFRGRRKNAKTVNGTKVFCSSCYVMDPYKTLRIRPGASESEVKKAFRQLALQYHPDVCRGSNCGVKFQTINEAYDVVMRQVRGHQMDEVEACEPFDGGADDGFMGMNEPDWEMWEEWMGWEGAGIRDYSSHINPFI